MKLKPYQEKKNYFNRFLKIYFYLSVLLILLSPFVIYQTGLWNKYKLEFVKRIHLNGMSNYKFIPNIIILVTSNMLNNIEKTVDLNINQENLIILENNRENKLKNPETSWEEVEGFLISENNKKIDTNIRLKGDRLFHYENRDHSSYKINTKSETFNKLSSFSIQKPRARNYIHEWIFHKLSRQLNVVSLDYEFVKFRLNGENQGLYVIEESFSNNLLEKNKRRAGPIFGLQEEFETANLENVVLDPYQINFWERPENLNLYLDSKKKLLKFFKKEINLEDLFDIEKWSAYFALCDLLNTHHGVLLKSVKFYYNPITQKFEPIAFDGHKLPAYDPSPIIDELNLYDHRSLFLKSLFNEKNINDDNIDAKNFSDFLKLFFFNENNKINEIFFQKYVQNLKDITNKKFLDDFFKKHQNEIDKINSKIYLDGFQFDYNTGRKKGLGIYYFDKSKIYERAIKINELFEINLDKISIDDYKDQIVLNNLDFNNLQLQVNQIFCKGNRNISVNQNLVQHLLIIKKKKSDLENLRCDKVIFVNRFTNEKFVKKISSNSYLEYKYELENYKKFFKIVGKKLYLKNDKQLIDFNIKIPDGYEVNIFPDQKINLINNAFIFSYSNWKVIGEENKPILINGLPNNFGGGIFIMSSKDNIFKNVNLEYLNGPDIHNYYKDGYILATFPNDKTKNFLYNYIYDKNYSNNLNNIRIFGAINFFDTKVEIKNMNFKNLSSEDSLNIINSSFDLRNLNFENIKSDAIDIDFSNGRISEVNLKNIGNDALDFSGSEVIINNINSAFVADKVISSGENSKLKINNLTSKNAFIGIANKDGSNLVATNLSFDNVEISFASYLKKDIYDQSFTDVSNFKSINTKKMYLLTKNSKLILDQKKQKNNISNKIINRIIYRKDKSLIN